MVLTCLIPQRHPAEMTGILSIFLAERAGKDSLYRYDLFWSSTRP